MTNWSDVGALNPHQIYLQLTNGPGAASIHEAQDAANRIHASHFERGQRIAQLADKIAAGWQGTAALAAYGAAQPLASHALARLDTLHTAQDLLGRDAESFQRARNDVRPVPPNPPESNILNDLTPWQTDLDKEIKQYQEDAQHNIAIFDAYDGASLYNETNMPQEYGILDGFDAEITVIPPPSSPAPEHDPGTGESSRSGEAIGERGSSETDTPLPGGTGVVGPVPGNAATSPHQGTGPGGWTTTAAPPSTSAQSPLPNQGTASGPGLGPVGGVGGFVAGGGGPGPVSRDGGQKPGSRQGVGGRMGVPGESAGRSGGAGARGSGPVPGVGGVVGRGKGGDDYEHETATYLENPDPDETFGGDQLTAPPVIGE